MTADLTTLPPSDPRAEALARLQASRVKLGAALLPEPGGGSALDGAALLLKPFRALSRWWRGHKPALAVGQALDSRITAGTGLPALAGEALDGSRRWVRRHPVPALALAVGAGALLVLKRQWVWGLALGIGHGLVRQGQGWLLAQVSNPSLYTGWFQQAAGPAADAAAGTGAGSGGAAP